MIDAIMRGDDIEIRIEVVEEVSEDFTIPVDITGYTIYFTGKRYADMEDAEADIQVQGTPIDPTHGLALIELPKEKTELLIPGELQYDIQVTSPLGKVITLERGVATVYSHITRRRV